MRLNECVNRIFSWTPTAPIEKSGSLRYHRQDTFTMGKRIFE